MGRRPIAGQAGTAGHRKAPAARCVNRAMSGGHVLLVKTRMVLPARRKCAVDPMAIGRNLGVRRVAKDAGRVRHPAESSVLPVRRKCVVDPMAIGRNLGVRRVVSNAGRVHPRAVC